MNLSLPTVMSRRIRHMPLEPSREDESKEARAERSLTRLDAVIEFRRRWREGWRLLAIVALPLVLSALAIRNARFAVV